MDFLKTEQNTTETTVVDSENSTRGNINLEPVTRVVLCGNPGVGKSTLLNALTGGGYFPSGISLGGGLTRRIRVVSIDDVEYTDTPGLADVVRGHSAAEQISVALSASGRDIILIFVTTLEAGAVRPADTQTICSVCDALERAGAPMRGRIVVVVNKCDMYTFEALHDTTSSFSCKLRAVYGQAWAPATIVPLPIFESDVAEDAKKNSGIQHLRRVIDHCKPLPLPPISTVSVIYKDPVAEARRARDLHASVVAMQAAVSAAQRERTRAGVVAVIVGVSLVVGFIKLARMIGDSP